VAANTACSCIMLDATVGAYHSRVLSILVTLGFMTLFFGFTVDTLGIADTLGLPPNSFLKGCAALHGTGSCRLGDAETEPGKVEGDEGAMGSTTIMSLVVLLACATATGSRTPAASSLRPRPRCPRRVPATPPPRPRRRAGFANSPYIVAGRRHHRAKLAASGVLAAVAVLCALVSISIDIDDVVQCFETPAAASDALLPPAPGYPAPAQDSLSVFGACRGSRPGAAPADAASAAALETSKVLWLRWLPHVRFVDNVTLAPLPGAPALANISTLSAASAEPVAGGGGAASAAAAAPMTCGKVAQRLLSLARNGANCDPSAAAAPGAVRQAPDGGLRCLPPPFPGGGNQPNVSAGFFECACDELSSCAAARRARYSVAIQHFYRFSYNAGIAAGATWLSARQLAAKSLHPAGAASGKPAVAPVARLGPRQS
jgi:hypothetical protein